MNEPVEVRICSFSKLTLLGYYFDKLKAFSRFLEFRKQIEKKQKQKDGDALTCKWSFQYTSIVIAA